MRIREEDLPLRLLARVITPEDLQFIRLLIARHPDWNRNQLAFEICRIWSWNKPNGAPKDISAKQLLIRLDESGLISLPPPRSRRSICKGAPRTPAGEPKPKMKVDLSELLPLEVQRVTAQADRNLWRELIDRYHYLGYNNGAGAQIRYFVHSPLGIVALFGFGACAWHVKDRDRWIGWDEEQRLKFRHLVVANTRFLILPWIRCRNLASKLLSMVTSRLRDDFRDAYNYAPVLVETFVDQEHFWGTSYKAANWRFVGATQGRGRNGSKKAKLTIKSVYLYPLTRDFRLVLTGRKIPD